MLITLSLLLHALYGLLGLAATTVLFWLLVAAGLVLLGVGVQRQSAVLLLLSTLCTGLFALTAMLSVGPLAMILPLLSLALAASFLYELERWRLPLLAAALLLWLAFASPLLFHHRLLPSLAMLAIEWLVVPLPALLLLALILWP